MQRAADPVCGRGSFRSPDTRPRGERYDQPVSLENLLLMLERIAGGRQAGVSISDEARAHPKTRRAFTWIMWLLVVELLIGVAAVVIALVLTLRGEPQPFAVWMRGLVVLGMTACLLYTSRCV